MGDFRKRRKTIPARTFGVVKKLSKVEIKQDVIDMSDVRSDGYSMNNQAPIL